MRRCPPLLDKETNSTVLNKIERKAPDGKRGEGLPAIELTSVSKWHGSVAQIDRRFVRNESLQTLIELMLSMRDVEGHRKGATRDKSLVPLLEGVTLTIERGSVVGVMDIGSPSRDAAIRIMENSEIPSAGVVRFFGKVAAFGQLGASVNPYLSCRQNIEFGARLVGIPRRDIRRAMEAVPEASGLGEHLDTPLRRLPKSIFTDLGISFLLCLDYDIMVADEVSRPRSETVSVAWRDYIAQAPQSGKTIITTSLNLDKLEGLCTHLLLIKEAEVLAYGPAQDIEEQYPDFIAEARATPKAEVAGFAAGGDEEDDDEMM